MDGPILLAKLTSGTYTIRATSYVKTLTRKVTVATQGLRQVDFAGPSLTQTLDDEPGARAVFPLSWLSSGCY